MKPILFSIDMVQAILEGRKTVTRRVVKPQPKDGYLPTWRGNWDSVVGTKSAWVVKPPCQPGDILYVRETFAVHSCNDRLPPSIPCKKTAAGRDCYIYFADGANGETPCGVWPSPHKWRPSIHMPREAARIFLRVTGVRVERLQASFTEPICPILELQAEGIDIGETCQECIENYGEPCCVDTVDEDGTDEPECGVLDEVRDDFARLWDSTIKPADRALYGWAANPWVWVIEFVRCAKPEVTP